METDSLSDAIAVIEALRAEIERLRAALKPLAAIALWSDAHPDCKRDHVADYYLGRYFTIDQIKTTRAAILDADGQPATTHDGRTPG